MGGQDFNTLDELRLEVSEEPTGIYNLAPNPDGQLGTWSWLTPAVGSAMSSDVPTPGSGLEYVHTGGGASYFTTDYIPIEQGQYVAAAFAQASLSNAYHKGQFEFYDASKNQLTVGAATALQAPSASAVTTVPAAEATIANTRYVRLIIGLYTSGGANPAGTHTFHFTDFSLAVADTSGALSGIAPGLAGLTYQNLLSPTHDIEVNRPRNGNATLTATILDESIDPATDDTVKPGRMIRLVRSDGEHLAPPMKIIEGNTSYTRDEDTNELRTRVQIVAMDTTTSRLASQPATDLVLEIEDLDHAVESAGVPWNFNGNTDHSFEPETLVAGFFSDGLDYSLLGVLGLIRDTFLGYLWTDRKGRINLFDRDVMPTEPVATFTDDGSGLPYTALDPTYSSTVLVNTLRINQLVDPVTGAPNVVAGPYFDPDSVAQYGTAEREVTIVGLDPSAYPNYAEAVFAANGLPQRRIGTLTMPVRTDTLEAATTLDLNDLVHVTFGTTYNADDRIAGIRHRITAGQVVADCRWFVDYTFESPDSVTTGGSSSSTGTTGGSTGGGTPVPIITRKPTVFYLDEHTVTEPGPQEITLTYVPKDYSEHLYWHHKGHGGIFWADDTWTREGKTFTVPDEFGILAAGDVLRIKYAMLDGQTPTEPEPEPEPEPDPDPGATLIVPDNAVVKASEPDYEGTIVGSSPQWGDSSDSTGAIFKCRFGTGTGNRRQRIDTQVDSQPSLVIDPDARIAVWLKIISNDHTAGFSVNLTATEAGSALAAGSESGGLLAPTGWTVFELLPTTGNTVESILTAFQSSARWLTVKHILPSPDPAGTYVKTTEVSEARIAIYYP